MKDLLVIGGASLDTLHVAGQPTPSAGGSGMYTAAAAHRAGGRVTMFAPRPHPIPELLRPFAERVEWLGPTVAPEELPHFEIAYPQGQTVFLTVFVGAEENLSPADLPADLSGYRQVHIGPLGTPRRQLDFLAACRERGGQRISASAFLTGTQADPAGTLALFQQADIFFMNEAEAKMLFGSVAAAKTSPGKLLFVTLGERGARVIQGDYATEIEGRRVTVVDTTGAGDTFTGGTLLGLARAEHPVVAARKAIGLAAESVQAVGPLTLWQQPAPLLDRRDGRVGLNPGQIQRIAQLVADLPEVRAFTYTDANFPPVGHPAALDFLCAATLQQFSFWETEAGRYHRPMIAPLGGVLRKGSDYLWQSYLRLLESDPAWYSPARQAELTLEDMQAVFRADDGSDPMPALELHWQQAQAYGRDMLSLGLTPAKLVAQANASAAPLQTFLELLNHVGGYKEDPLRKKATLLAIILAERPEHFLRPAAGEVTPPIIDYHLQRSCLRTGLIEVRDSALLQALEERRVVSAADEQAVREAAYDACGEVAALSGKSIQAVDWFFFNFRRRCPEMTEPECAVCPVDPVCTHRKALFQPVFRTTFY